MVKQKIAKIEDASKAKNVVLFKIKDEGETNAVLLETVMNIFSEIGLGVPETAIDSVFRLGKIPGNRPILVRFIASRWKSTLFQKIDGLKKIGIGISNDLNREQRQIIKELLVYKKYFQEQNKPMKIKGNNLVLEDKMFSLEDLKATVNIKVALPNQDRSSQNTALQKSKNVNKTPNRRSKRNLLKSMQEEPESLITNFFTPPRTMTSSIQQKN